MDNAVRNIVDHLTTITDWYLAMPLVDHDGGDEDDQLVEQRRLFRALRYPGARCFRQGDRLYVVREPDLMRPLVPSFFEQRTIRRGE